MIRTFLVPLLAIVGVIFAVYTVVKGSMPPAATPPVIEPPQAPYQSFVAGSLSPAARTFPSVVPWAHW
jgi:hypothetical protein